MFLVNDIEPFSIHVFVSLVGPISTRSRIKHTIAYNFVYMSWYILYEKIYESAYMNMYVHCKIYELVYIRRLKSTNSHTLNCNILSSDNLIYTHSYPYQKEVDIPNVFIRIR